MRRLLALGFVLLAVPVSAQVSVIGIPPGSLAPPVIVFPASAVNGGGTVTSAQLLLPDGSANAPSAAFTSAPNKGVYSSGSGELGIAIAGLKKFAFDANNLYLLSDSASIDLGSAQDVNLGRAAAGRMTLTNASAANGASLKFDALPTVSVCGAGSPAVVAGSTPLAGSVTIGTTSVATCTITFNGTAFPSAPHCSGAVETTTAANARAMGYSATTTVLTIVPASAWADSSVVNWTCISSK